jgi:hypothetical protein
MSEPVNILVLGAAYGLLPAARLSLGGHRVTVVCGADERQALATHGASITLQRRDGKAGRILHVPAAFGRANSPGVLGLTSPVNSPDGFDLVFLAMSEPHYADAAIAKLMGQVADLGLPTVALMNLLPACFLRRLGRLDVDALRPAYAAWDVWHRFDPRRVTAASPDAQAVRLQPERPDLLTVTLASNFKVAPFDDRTNQSLLEAVAASTERVEPDAIAAPARIVAQDSLGVPLSKWPMLITGNCRCLSADGSLSSIAAAVHAQIDDSREIYENVARISMAAGASARDIVPFGTYAAAARQLSRPSSLARAVAGGAYIVERIDLMILHAAEALSLPSDVIAEVSHNIDRMVRRNAVAACTTR